MGLLDRFFKKPIEPSVTKRAVPGLSGNLTAHQAWTVVAQVMESMGRNAKLTLITSGLDMDDQGCSHTWEFLFFLPRRKVTVMLSLEPDPQAVEIDSSPCILTQRINNATSVDADRQHFPYTFRDSPDVVAEFSASGVDFSAGPSDMKMEGRILSSGEAVWVTYYWGKEYTTSFKK